MDARGRSLPVESYLVRIDARGAPLEGHLQMPAEPRGIVLLADSSATAHHDRRHQWVAQSLREDVGVGTLLIDLATADDEVPAPNRDLLAERLVAVCDWITSGTRTRGLPIGLFGASTAAAAALIAAAERPNDVAVVVSRAVEAEPDRDILARVRAPTLLLTEAEDLAAFDNAASWFDRYLPVVDRSDEPRG
jgi:putative phosphoribosyl transferase